MLSVQKIRTAPHTRKPRLQDRSLQTTSPRFMKYSFMVDATRLITMWSLLTIRRSLSQPATYAGGHNCVCNNRARLLRRDPAVS
jgi:hypothetical protein